MKNSITYSKLELFQNFGSVCNLIQLAEYNGTGS